MGHDHSRIVNDTEIPVVFVLSMLGPLYWGVLQPGEEARRSTGQVWFTVTVFPYDGTNEPTNTDAALGVLVPAAFGIFELATFGAATAAVGTVASALESVATSALIPVASTAGDIAVAAGHREYAFKKEFVDAATKSLNKAQITGYYANGTLLHVRGGIKKNEPYSAWTPMQIEY